MTIKDWIIVALLVLIILHLMGESPLANEEIIEWDDYRGDHMKIRVNRSLH